MTNEQAIAHFKEQLEVFGGEHHEAMKVAIEALKKQVPKNDGWTETCLTIQKILIEHGIEPLGELANAIFDAVLKERAALDVDRVVEELKEKSYGFEGFEYIDLDTAIAIVQGVRNYD